MSSLYKTILFCTFFIVVYLCAITFTNNIHHSLLTSTTVKSGHCRNIDLQVDQCAFVKKTCHGFSALYLEFYYCSSLWKPLILGILLSGLLLLFGAISVVASDFFCPNLQTIASKLELSESLAGVTVLAFGNGSPDLFGTFSAMDSGSGSMAIGEIIGAAFFIVSVITGCMGIIRPFQSKRITFMRDASFLTGAVAMLTWIVYHGKIYWYHGLALIGYYITYVVTVLLSSYQWNGLHDNVHKEMASKLPTAQNLLDETSRLLGTQGNQKSLKPPRLDIPDQGFLSSGSDYEPHLGHIIRPMSPLSSKLSSLRIDTSVQQQQQQQQRNNHMPRTASTNGSISTIRPYRRAMTPRVGIRTSLFGAIEFQSQISAIRRASSSQQVMTSLMVPGSGDPQQRQRQVSVPQEFWQHRSRNSSFNNMQFGRSPNGRQRASTVVDQLAVAHPSSSAGSGLSPTLQRPTTPESTNSSTGVAEDYFAYLSTHQPQAAQLPLVVNTASNLSSSTSPASSATSPASNSPVPPPHPVQRQNLPLQLSVPPSTRQRSSSLTMSYQQQQQQVPEMTIPEIRLAPPIIEQYHTPMTSAISPNENYYRQLPSPLQQNNHNRSLHVTPSPSMASSTYDCFVSARQSPELTPTVFDREVPSLTVPILRSHHETTGDANDEDDIEQKLQTASYIANHINNSTSSNRLSMCGNDANNNNDNINGDSWWVQIQHVLFPTLHEWSTKSWFSRISSLVAMPLVLIFTITLPVAEAEDVRVDEMEVMMCDDDDDYVYQTSAHLQISQPPPPFAENSHNSYGSVRPSSTASPTLTCPAALPVYSLNNDTPDRLLTLPVDAPSLLPNTMAHDSTSSYLTVPASESDCLLGSQQLQSNRHDRHATSTSDVLDVTDADLQQGWCRWLLASQAVFSTTFVFCILVFNEFIEASQIIIGVGVGLILCFLVLATTKTDEPPEWFWMLSFAGFVISLNWIFLLANAMVGLLQALGKIFDISEAIMGLTVFAFGNSVGDLVSNTAIAKMGFPTMAISACYAGPLLNMVLGVGVSSTYQIWKAHGQPFVIAIPPTILISSAGLLTVLLSTLFVVNMNGYHVNKQLGYWTISVYTFCCIVNLLLEFTGFKS